MFEYLRMLPANRGMLVLSYHFIWQSLVNERCGYKTKRVVTQWYLQNDEPESTLVSCRAVNAMHLVVPSSPSCTVLVILPSRCDGAERLVVFTIFTGIIALFGVN